MCCLHFPAILPAESEISKKPSPRISPYLPQRESGSSLIISLTNSRKVTFNRISFQRNKSHRLPFGSSFSFSLPHASRKFAKSLSLSLSLLVIEIEKLTIVRLIGDALVPLPLPIRPNGFSPVVLPHPPPSKEVISQSDAKKNLLQLSSLPVPLTVSLALSLATNSKRVEPNSALS